ncbi:hypothetical protein K504DRAFT_500058 [Pleomassaria siparia CBS 279.74]|uniref:Ankyrin n=1 Tax=Pleomassaria siparia CBS 279.74 TaxID=1314801 RepID=A0A6G1KG52_9PLEO|nr:hypothetical protein K504DRAFT_500058 [Pleomassaria siparia CBS 279.74]
MRMVGLDTKDTLKIAETIGAGNISASKNNLETRPQQTLRDILPEGDGSRYTTTPEAVKNRSQATNTARRRAEQDSHQLADLRVEKIRNLASSSIIDLPHTPENTQAKHLRRTRSVYNFAVRCQTVLARPLRKTTLDPIPVSHGRTPSILSGLANLLGKLTVAAQDAQYSTSNSVSPPRSVELPVAFCRASILESQSQRNHRANTAIIDACCRNTTTCAHRWIASADIYPHKLYTLDIDAIDSFGNNLLFFAARTGASLSILLSLIDLVTDVNAINEYGQTFLFALSPDVVRDEPSITSFVQALRGKQFNFTHVDDEGRTFLSLLCLHYDFSISWLQVLEKHFFDILVAIGLQQDASGAILLDYLRRCGLDAWLPSKTRQFLTLKPVEFVAETVPGHENFFLNREYEYDYEFECGHEYDDESRENNWSRMMLSNVYSYLQSGRCVDLQLYGDSRFVPIAFKARDREHRTLLHYSTIFNQPNVLQQVLDITGQTLQVNHRDRHGFSALDYAVDNSNQIRRLSGIENDLANALKCILTLVDAGANMTSTTTPGGARMTTDSGRDVLIPDTEPIVHHLKHR